MQLRRRDLPVVALAFLANAAVVPPSAAKKVGFPTGATVARRWNGLYSDMLHVGCDRRITMDTTLRTSSMDGREYFVAHFTGSDIGPPGIGDKVELACNENTVTERDPLREWEFDAKVSVDGDFIDASDNVHVGRWHEPDASTPDSDWSGIRWRDGNRWTYLSPLPAAE